MKKSDSKLIVPGTAHNARRSPAPDPADDFDTGVSKPQIESAPPPPTPSPTPPAGNGGMLARIKGDEQVAKGMLVLAEAQAEFDAMRLEAIARGFQPGSASRMIGVIEKRLVDATFDELEDAAADMARLVLIDQSRGIQARAQRLITMATEPVRKLACQVCDRAIELARSEVATARKREHAALAAEGLPVADGAITQAAGAVLKRLQSVRETLDARLPVWSVKYSDRLALLQ
jgi:hypothetical protein